MPEPHRSGGWPGAFKHRPFVRIPYLKYLKFKARSVQRFIFVATTGRSGSGSLAEVFSCIDDCVSLHEPTPVMTSLEIAAERELFGSVDRLMDLKLIQILRAASGAKVYLETNHQFIKNFSDVAVRHLGTRLRVVHLFRNPVDVAISLHRIGSIPGITDRGKRYLLDPAAPSNCISLSGFSADESFEQQELLRCLWYCYEMEARVARFKENNPDVPVRLLRTEHLNDFERMTQLLEDFEIAFDPPRLRSVIGTKANRKTHKGDSSAARDEVVSLDSAFRSYVEGRYGSAFAEF